MKIIAIEGIDKSGKHTQAVMLKERFLKKGYLAIQSEFPRYDTPTGELIQKWLRKEFEASREVFELLQAADKQLQQKVFETIENSGVDFLILDRYYLSQYAFSKAANIDEDWIINLNKYIRKSDFDILINLPADESLKRRGKYGSNDRLEEDMEYLNKCNQCYLDIYRNSHNSIVIDGSIDRNAINDAIWESLTKKFEIF